MIRTPLMEHQRQIVDFCKTKEFAGIFAEYGTGKTLCTLKLAEELHARKILVVCSKTAILATWPSEIAKHTDYVYTYLLGTKAQRMEALRYGLIKARVPSSNYAAQYIRPVFFLINYDGVKSIYNELAASNFDMLIVDESTKIKYPTTQRTKIMWALGKSVECRYILTGFPITESPQDLYSQIKFLDNGKTFGNSYYGFMDKFFIKMGYKYVPKKGAPQDIIAAIESFCIRVTNESLKLPPKRYFKNDIKTTPEQSKYLRELKDYMQLEIGKVHIDTQYIFNLIVKSCEICDGFVQSNWCTEFKTEEAKILTCQQCKYEMSIELKVGKPVKCPKCKFSGHLEVIPTNKDEMLVDILEEIDTTHNKVLIWTPFRFTVFKLTKLLEHHGINSLQLTGATNDIKAVVDKFMVSKDTNVLILTEKKAAESLNLTNCNIAIYYSNEWSYDKRANSEARIYRKGSEKHPHVIYIDFVTEGTIEETIYKCLRTKKSLVDELKSMFGGKVQLTEDKIQNIEEEE